MKLSEKRKSAIYAAIDEQIIQARIQIARQPEIQSTAIGASIDLRLAQLVETIYRDVLAELVSEVPAKKKGRKTQ